MIRPLLAAALAALAIPFHASPAGVIRVPDDLPTIQAGIDSSSDGDTVLVAPGTYFENINFHGRKIVLASNYLFSGDVADVHATVIDGSQPADPDTASCVLFIGGEDSTTVLEGFTLTGGTGTLWRDIHNNNVYREGGGILVEFSSPVIRNNVIVRNDASGPGGTSAGGGGIRIGDANPTVAGNVIAYNTGRYGGGIVLNYTAAKIRNNIIYRNSGGSDFGGSGIWMVANGSGAWNGPKVIENNTIMENASTTYGGGFYVGSTSAVLRNNIIRANTAPQAPQISLDGGTVAVTYSNVEGGWAGAGNINLDPGIGDTTHRLEPGSPCIDAGDPAAAYDDPEDTLNPGTALHPSMGALRNDIGAFGGPGRGLLYLRIHRNAPQSPSGVGVYSDYSTPHSAAITWVDPAELFNGSPIPPFEIHVYRDSMFIAAVPPGTEGFVDTGLVLHQSYRYGLNAVTAVDSSPIVEVSVFAGGSAVPAPPTGLKAYDGPGGSVIGWLTPSRQADGTPLNDLAMAYLYRDGLLADSIPLSAADTGAWRIYTDTAMGYHWFRLAVRDDEVPWNFSASTDSALGYGGLSDSYHEDFETGPGTIARTGSWDTTSGMAHGGGRSLTDSPAGNSAPSTTTSVLLPPVRLDGRYVLEFQNIAVVRGGGFAYVEVSVDGRKTFTTIKVYNAFFSPKWLDGSADSADWIRFALDLSAYTGDTATVRMRLLTGSLAPWDGWYVDDISIRRVDPDSDHAVGGAPGWNLVSLPVVAAGPVDSLFPSAAPSAWTWDGIYRRTASVSPGPGYWAKFDSGSLPTVRGALIPADTVDLKAGWNLVGAVGFAIDSSAVRTQPAGIVQSSFFAYDPDSGYVRSGALIPGKAYWVRASAVGRMIRSVFFPSAPPTSPAVVATSGAAQVEPGAIEFTDAAGRRRTLSFGARDTTAPAPELPPPPPSGVFDIRFASGLALERVAGEGVRAVPILLSGVSFPVTVRWRPGSDPGVSATLLVNGAAVPIDGEGGLTIASLTTPMALRISGDGRSAVPPGFSLAGNFPNPFNPSTTIGFALPEARFVSLRVFDILGREVAELAGRVFEPGRHGLAWDASAAAGGVYVYRLVAGEYSATGRMLLMK